MNIDFPNHSEKKMLLEAAKRQNYLMYLGRRASYFNPKIYDILFEVYRSYGIIKFFGLKDFLFGSKKGNIDFLLVGFPKSGTTSLHEYLLQHPNFSSSWTKEPGFFSYRYEKGINHYLKNFRFKKNNIYFESSTNYIYHPHTFKRVKQFNPKMKFIICLRNPVDQVFSHWNHAKQNGLEFDSFEDALLKEDFKRKLHLERLEKKIYSPLKVPVALPYLYIAEHVTHIKIAFEEFDQENFFFVNSVDLLNDTQKTMNNIFNFLGKDSISITPTLHNKRSYVEKMSPKTRDRLSSYFKPYNLELEKLLHINLNWN